MKVNKQIECQVAGVGHLGEIGQRGLSLNVLLIYSHRMEKDGSLKFVCHAYRIMHVHYICRFWLVKCLF